MTAEVAVMNRSAVALAADSAVTLSGLNPSAGVDKIFQNENKLFELSTEFPVGLMIYNATAFFDIPWEVIIKDFRSDEGHISSDSVFDWADRFREYLMSHVIFKPSNENQKRFAKNILRGEFSKVFDDWINEVRPLLFQKQTRIIMRQYPTALKYHLRKRVSYYERINHYAGFSDGLAGQILEEYRTEYEEAKQDCFGEIPFDADDDELLDRLARAVFGRSRRNWFTTGLVFSGYGVKELFPSLISIEVGGSLNDRLRWSEQRRVDIDRASTTAEIIPFAQRETVDTLLFGRADSYEARVVKYFTTGAKKIAKGVVEQLTRKGQRRQDFEDRVDAAVNAVVRNFYDHHAEQLKIAFARDTLDSVRHMPKPDLAAFAESLVTVTSMMRKASIGPETVGGPIDVAVISRHEGFIWVRRKHYFDTELNQRYMWRAFGAGKKEGGSDAGS